MNTESRTQPLPRALVDAFGLPPQQEGGALVGDGLMQQGVLCGVSADWRVIVRGHRLLVDAVGRALERQDRG